MLEKWCVEKRKNSYSKDNNVNLVKNEGEKALKDFSITYDTLIEKAWIEADNTTLNILIDIIQKGKINSIYES